MQNIYQNEGKRLLRTREFAERLGISVATLYRLIAAGKLPPPIKIGGASAWPSSDLDAIVERRATISHS